MANYLLTKSTNTHQGVNTQPGAGVDTTIVAAGDSGSITTIPQPGGSAVKLTDMTQQSATTAQADSTVASGGNFITKAQVATFGPAGNSLGYSILGS